MKFVERPDDSLYAAAIAWDVEKLMRTQLADAHDFVRVFQLAAEPNLDNRSEPSRMSPLRRAIQGLLMEFGGDEAAAREQYRRIMRNPGLPGVLGALLLAWMTRADEDDFDRTEKRADAMEGRRSGALRARVHTKLAMWALDRGWSDRARHHYARALGDADKPLQERLEGVGHWFGRQRVVHIRVEPDDRLAFTALLNRMDDAARKSVEEQFRETFRSPWSRTWTFGSYGGPEGADIASAELQASWAGALWLMPTIQRQHAALIMAKSRDAADVARAMALWIRGGGKSPDGLINTYEGFLSKTSVENLLVNELHEGRSVYDPSTWNAACHALWDQMPDHLLETLVERYPGPAAKIPMHGRPAEELGLFAKLLIRSKSAARKIMDLNSTQRALVARSVPPSLVSNLPHDVSSELLNSAVVEAGNLSDDWRRTGWAALARMCSNLKTSSRSEIIPRMIEGLPADSIAEVAAVSPDLVPANMVRDAVATAVGRIQTDIADAAGGVYAGRATEPAIDLGRLLLAANERDPDAVDALVALSTNINVTSTQRHAALRALVALARRQLLEPSWIVDAGTPLEGTRPDPWLSWPRSDDDNRLEGILRTALRTAFRYDSDAVDGAILAASRDESVQVRQVALDLLRGLTVDDRSLSSALDAASLGALYDPHPAIQAAAAPIIWRGSFQSEVLRGVAKNRILEMWPTAHRDVRIAVASELSGASEDRDPISRELAQVASTDRSFLVRTALRPPLAEI